MDLVWLGVLMPVLIVAWFVGLTMLWSLTPMHENYPSPNAPRVDQDGRALDRAAPAAVTTAHSTPELARAA